MVPENLSTLCVATVLFCLSVDGLVLTSAPPTPTDPAPPQVADLFAALLEIWSDKLDVMVELEQRKMTGLAMACLLSVRDQ